MDKETSELIEKIEALLLQYARDAALPGPSPYRSACRTAAAEYATILRALKARASL